MQIARNPGKIARQFFVADDLVNLVDGGATRVPGCLGVVAAEVLHKIMEAQVCDEGEVSGCVTGVDAAAAVALEQNDGAAGLLEQIRRRHACDACTDHGDVCLQVFFQAVKPGELEADGPAWFRGHEISRNSAKERETAITPAPARNGCSGLR